MNMDLAIDLAVLALLLAAIGVTLEVCRCLRRVAAASVRALDAQAAYWRSGDDDEWWKRGEGNPA